MEIIVIGLFVQSYTIHLGVVKSTGKLILHCACTVFVTLVVHRDSKGGYTLISVQGILFIVLPTMINLYQNQTWFNVPGQNESCVPALVIFRQIRIKSVSNECADNDHNSVAGRGQNPNKSAQKFSAADGQQASPKNLAFRGSSAFVDRMEPSHVVHYLAKKKILF